MERLSCWIVCSFLSYSCLSGLCVSQAQALPTALELKDAIHYAISHHPLLQIATIDKNLRLQDLMILQRQFDPEIVLNARATVQNEDYFHESFIEKKLHTYPSLRMKTPYGTQIDVSTEQNIGYEKDHRSKGTAMHIVIEQPLLRGRAKRVNTLVIEDAKIMNDIQDLLFSQTLDQIIYQIIVQYRTLQLASNNMILHEKWLNQAKVFYDNLEAKVDLGRQPVCDLPAASFQIQQAAARLREAEIEYQSALRKLLLLINWGEKEAPEIPFSSELSEDIQKMNQEDITDRQIYLQRLMQNDIQSKIYQLNHKKLEQQLFLAKDQQEIDLKLRGEWTTGRYHIDNSPPTTDPDLFPFVHQSGNYAAHLLMSIPLKSKQERNQKISQAKMALLKHEIEYTNYLKELEDNAQQLLDQVEVKKQQYRLSQVSLKLSEQQYESALLKLEADRVALFEVDVLREKFYEAQIAFDAAKISYFNTMANRDLSLGVLTKRWLIDIK